MVDFATVRCDQVQANEMIKYPGHLRNVESRFLKQNSSGCFDIII